jgi:uncharacterized membrane protein YgcG
MNENGSQPLADIFDECLADLETGRSIEEILAARAADAEDLRPLLETAGAALALRPAEPGRGASHRGRTRMLVHAARLRQRSARPSRRWSWPRLALQLSALFVVLAVSLTSLVAVSAQSLPGDRLYGVKLAAEGARLNAAGDQARSVLEDALRERRISEIEELLRLRRSAPVIFEGVVTAIDGTAWTIAGLETAIGTETVIIGDILPGMYVEVRGRTTGDGRLLADAVYLRAYAFAGTLLARNGAIWRIDEIPVLITDETQLAPNLEIGDQVVVLAQVDDEGTIAARAVLLGQQAFPGPQAPLPGDSPETATPVPDPEPSEFGSETPEPDPEADPEAEETEDDEFETEEPEAEDDSDNSGPGSGSSGSGSSGSGSSGSGSSGSGIDDTEEPEDD